MSASELLKYHRHLDGIAQADVEYVRRKDAQYEASWKKRGGAGAFFTIVRPWDRFDSRMQYPRTFAASAVRCR